MADSSPRDPLLTTPILGTGPEKLIAIHGWMGASDLFAPLHEHIDGRRWSVCFMDCRGYGARRSVPGEMSIEEIASDALGLADHLGWGRFHLLGHSMAAMAAQRLMIDAPDRLASVVLLAPVPAGGARIDAARRERLLAATTDPAVRLELIDANSGSVREREWLERLRDLSLAGTAPEAMTRYLDSWTGPGFAAELRGNARPATVIIGSLDPGTPEGRAREVYGDLLASVRFEVLDGLGHYAMREDPRALAAALGRHLDRLSRE